MHFCPDELNALVNGLPLMEHLTRFALHAWYWMCAKACGHDSHAN